MLVLIYAYLTPTKPPKYILRRDIIRSIVGPVQQPNFEILEPSAAEEQIKRFGSLNPTGQPLDDSDEATSSTQNDATFSSTGWSLDSFDTMASYKTTNIPQISAEYVANLLDYKHVVSVLEQPVSIVTPSFLFVIIH